VTRRAECLFVGGPADGERRLVDVDHIHRFTRSPGLRGVPRFDEPVPQTVDQVAYVPHQFEAEGKRWTVFAEQGVSPAEIMRALISKYPRPGHD
jgi:hypothetical protein